MKAFIILCLNLIPSMLFCQTDKPPKIYLNDKIVNLNYVFINPNSIESIQVKKEKPGGEMFIQTKEKRWEYKSLEEFSRSFPNYEQIYDKSITAIFMIDKMIIIEPDSVKIDARYFGKATLKNISEVKGVTETCKNLVLIDIEIADSPIISIQ